MSSQSPSSPVYHTSVDQKLKSKNAAKLHRFGSPNIRDLLREKCRIRIKEARQQGFSDNRLEGGAIVGQFSLKRLLREELAELEHDIALQNKIYIELEEEVNAWFAEQLEEEQNYLIDVAVSQDVICPICQLSNLVIFQNKDYLFNYRCKCNANFTLPYSLQSLQVNLSQCIDKHEKNCLSKLNFFVNPLSNELEGMCENCDYFCTL